MAIFDQETKNLISCCKSFLNFRSSNPGSVSGIRNPDPQLEKMLDPDPYPDPHLINADPKPWIWNTDSIATYPIRVLSLREKICVVDPRKFHCGSGSSILGQS
jgi:hypothetical protein